MSSVRTLKRLSTEDYLANEERAEVRHEYVDGFVQAMVGCTARHNLIASAMLSNVRAHLKGSECRVFMSDMKVRAGNAFYYPDVVVSCRPIAPKAVYLSEPVLIVEVLSETTEARDRLEKWIAYRSLASLREYVLLAQDRPAIDVYRRTQDGWVEINFGEAEDLELTSIELKLPLSELYAELPPD
jgi:Uma2 family endonuclease